jgi:hypothetical protein
MGMSDRWMIAAIVGSTGAAALVAAVALGERTPPACLVAIATAAPAAVGLAVWARLGRGFPGRALVGGAMVGPFVAVAGHAAVAAFAVAFFLGFADAGRSLLETVRVDPTLARLVTSPWVVLAMAEYVVAAPITEEAGKYLGSRAEGRGRTRSSRGSPRARGSRWWRTCCTRSPRRRGEARGSP